MKRLTYIAFFIVTLSVIAVACTKKPDIGNTSTVKMAGEFWVETYADGAIVADFAKVMTYNTSDPNSGQVWFDDIKHIWPVKAKLDVDYSTLSFKAKTGIPNTYLTGKTLDVVEGKIIPNGGHSKTGVVVDSFYLKAKFSDDPGPVYEFKGHGRTGFFEDEY